MGTLNEIVLVACAALLAQDRSSFGVPEGLVETPRQWSFSSAQQDLVSVRMPLTATDGPLGNLLLTVHGQGHIVSSYPAVLPTFEPWAPLDRGTMRVGLRWHDRFKDEVEGSVGARANFLTDYVMEDAAVSWKVLLPEPLIRWYLLGTARADTERSEQMGFSVGSAWDFDTCGSRLVSSLGVIRQDVHRRSREQLGNNVVNWTAQWRWSDRLKLGIGANYYIDVRETDALVTLEVRSRVPLR
jgi:hypothetical protein